MFKIKIFINDFYMLYDSKEIKSTLKINYFIIRHKVVLLLMNQHNLL